MSQVHTIPDNNVVLNVVFVVVVVILVVDVDVVVVVFLVSVAFIVIVADAWIGLGSFTLSE